VSQSSLLGTPRNLRELHLDSLGECLVGRALEERSSGALCFLVASHSSGAVVSLLRSLQHVRCGAVASLAVVQTTSHSASARNDTSSRSLHWCSEVLLAMTFGIRVINRFLTRVLLGIDLGIVQCYQGQIEGEQMTPEKIMVIDDDLNIRLVLKYRLEREGYHVLLAGDGVNALEKVKAEKPDLIILDLAMPRMDGFKFLEQMKDDSRAVPVIVLTAYGDDLNRAKSFELGAVEFIPKPFSPRQLVAEVWKILGAKREKVLVIDDDASVRDLLVKSLEVEGCLVDVAEDGPSGIEKALAGDYDLIFMDDRMPGCRADEATERIIAEKLKQRIVIVTADPDDESVHRALENGALACVSKPFAGEDVRRLKRELLG